MNEHIRPTHTRPVRSRSSLDDDDDEEGDDPPGDSGGGGGHKGRCIILGGR